MAIVVLSILAGSAAASSTYSWTLKCIVSPPGASASWSWLQNGAVIATGGASCFTSSSQTGGGTRPAGANGIAVTLSACVFSSLYGVKCSSTNGRASFGTDGPFRLSLTASISAYGESSKATFTISGT